MAASVAPNMPQPSARVVTCVTTAPLHAYHKCIQGANATVAVYFNVMLSSVSAEQTALSMPMPTPAALQQEQQQQPSSHPNAVDKPEAIPVVAGSVAMDPAAPVLAKGGSKVSSKKKSKAKAKTGSGSKKKKKLAGPPCVGLYVDALVRISLLIDRIDMSLLQLVCGKAHSS